MSMPFLNSLFFNSKVKGHATRLSLTLTSYVTLGEKKKLIIEIVRFYEKFTASLKEYKKVYRFRVLKVNNYTS